MNSRLLDALLRVDASHPHERKRLLGVDVNHGRELLLAMARQSGGWVGWEATTLRGIADELTFVELHTRGLRVASDVELAAFVALAFERVIDSRLVDAQFASMSQHRGFRTALQNSILELRMASVTPDELRRAATAGSPASQLAPVAEEYALVLDEHGMLDPAGVFAMALSVFDTEAPLVLDGITVLAPTLSTNGVTGELVKQLLRHGALVLDVDRAIARADDVVDGNSLLSTQDDAFARSALGWSQSTDVPALADARFDAALVSTDIFAASTPSEELREVCRRAMREGLRWDDIEIVTTDPDTYGIALDALCQPLGIGATMLKGIPLARTRVGRALERWFTWIGNGLPADVLRQALEAGEIPVHAVDVAAHDVAHALRLQRVGWGRARYEATLERLSAAANARPDDPEEDDEVRTARRRTGDAQNAGLITVLRELLPLTPPVPERGSQVAVRTSSARLAAATLAYMHRVELRDAAEEQTAERLTLRLERLARLDDDEMDFAAALAGLRDSLLDLRAWPTTGMARKGYRADGGLLHLTDLAHAGSSGRSRTFVVGLDAERTGGAMHQDPLLPDAVRRAIGGTRLPDSAERRAQWLARLGVSFSSLRGRVTLSWAMRAADGRNAGPAPLVLQVFRVLHTDALLTFEHLRAAVAPPACAVPSDITDAGVLDARDVWLRAIAGSPSSLDATALVRRSFPMLDAGLCAAALAQGTELCAAHGLVPAAAAVLDPTRPGARRLSPSSLEALGRCPTQWFYKYGLRLQPPNDPAFDDDAWLDAAERGSLLHEIFESFVATHRVAQSSVLDAAAADAMTRIAQATIERWRELVPPPGDGVCAAESAELHRAARAFLQMEREAFARGETASWTSIEYAFGESTRAGYRLTTGDRIALHGRADRIDTFPDGSLRVVDYKTGSASRYRPNTKSGAFNGGRLLQPALYAEAIGGELQVPVSRFEYRFPTDRGANAIVAFDAMALASARDVVTSLVEHVKAGHFLPTTDPDDCTYCDFATICRVRQTGHDVASPRADWARANAATMPAYASMVARRGDAASKLPE